MIHFSECTPWLMMTIIYSIVTLMFLFFFKRFYLFTLRERAREWEREGEKHQCVVVSHVPPTGDLAHNPGMHPDWEWNWWSFSSQAGAQSTESHHSCNIFHSKSLPGMNSLSFCITEKVFIFIFETYFHWAWKNRFCSFFFWYFKDVFLLSYCFHSFQCKICCHPYLCSTVHMWQFFSLLCLILFLSLI